MIAKRKQQRGVSVIFIVFILVVLSALAAVVSNLAATQAFITAYSQRSSQAYFAARSGMDYAVARVTAAAGCGGITTPLTIDGYSVVIACSISGSFNEGAGSNYTIYDLTVTASRGSFTAPDVSNRQLQATIKFP